MKRLKGHKFLVMGNHDRLSVTKLRAWGFEDVWRKSIFYSVAGRMCTLSHYPHSPFPFTKFTLHGHVHTRNKRVGSNIHIGVDAWDYYPVPESEVAKLMTEHEEELGLDE